MKTNEELESLKKAYCRVFDSDDGKRIEEDLRKACGQDHSSMDEQNPNALKMAFNEGKRRIYLRIQMMRKVDQ